MNHPDPTQELVRVLRTFDTGMFVTSETDRGALRARPMSVARIADNGDLSFVTSIDSQKTDEILKESRVAVVFQQPLRYASISGDAKILVDRAEAARLWREEWRPWFPDGPEDASLVVVHVSLREGEYWDMAGLRGVKYAIDAVRSALTGTRMAEVADGHHGRVEPVEAAPSPSPHAQA